MVKKVVINKCYGGFGLSLSGAKHLAKLKGYEKLYFYKYDYSTGDLVKMSSEELEQEDLDLIFQIYTKDMGDIIVDNNAHEFRFTLADYDDTRDDKDLVATVEELGSKVNSKYSDLKVVEIPDGVEFTIESYDGVEWVAEKHRTWH